MKRIITALLALVICLLSGCGADTPATPAATDTNTQPQVTLRVAGGWADCRAMEWAASAFNAQYPNCTVVYEYLQGDYFEVLKERMQSPGDDRVDVFLTTANIQEGQALENAALDLMSCEKLDLSQTFPSLKENYMYIESDGLPATKLYAVPLGAQMRGLYVNTTLLKQVGIENVPKNQAEFLSACEVLKNAGYVPVYGEPGVFAQQLLYPWICNNIANADDYQAAYDLVNSRDIAATELFRDVYEFMYTLVENDYYDYYLTKKVMGICVDSSNEEYARSLLNIAEVKDDAGEGTGEYVLQDGFGQVAFLASALSLKPTMESMKEDYHSPVEYVFVPAPVGVDGGYVYLSPGDAIGVNKDTEKVDWAVKFLNFLFTPENNEVFAELFCIMPNTSDTFNYVSSQYDVPANHVSELGQATFDWSFYRTLTRSTGDVEDTRALPAISKANSPEWLDPETGEMYPFEYYWEQFQREFTGEE